MASLPPGNHISYHDHHRLQESCILLTASEAVLSSSPLEPIPLGLWPLLYPHIQLPGGPSWCPLPLWWCQYGRRQYQCHTTSPRHPHSCHQPCPLWKNCGLHPIRSLHPVCTPCPGQWFLPLFLCPEGGLVIWKWPSLLQVYSQVGPARPCPLHQQVTHWGPWQNLSYTGHAGLWLLVAGA